MKGDPPTNDVRMSLEPAAALCLNILQLIKRTEDAIGQWLIGERPQAFCGLQFRRMRGQKEQMQPFGNHQSTTLVPASLIQHQENLLVWPHALFLCESSQNERKDLCIDRGHEQPRRLSTRRLDKAIQIHPLIARSHHCPHSAPFACPDPAQDRFEADAVLILSPHFNPGFGICLDQLADLLGQFF